MEQWKKREKYFIRTDVTLSDIADEFTIDESELEDRVKEIPIYDSLILLSYADLFLSINSPDEFKIQEKLIDLFFKPKVAQFLKNLIRIRQFDVVFHHQQIFLAMNLIIANGSMDKKKDVGNLPEQLGLILLNINDVYKKVNVREKLDEEELTRYLWQNKNFSSVYHFSTLYEIARSYVIYCQSPEKDKMAMLFQRITGIKFNTYWAVVSALIFIFRMIDFSSKNLYIPIVDVSNFLRNAEGVDREDIRKVFDLLAADISSMKKSIQSKYDKFKNKSFNFMNLIEKPLLKIDQNRFLCLSFPHFVYNSTRGIVELLRINMASQKDQDKLADVKGTAYENYIKNILIENFPDTGRFKRLYLGIGKRKSRYDAVIDYGDELVWIEVKSVIIQKRYKLSENISDIERGLENFLTKKGAKQIHDSITSFKEGQLRIRNIKPENIKKHWPVIISCIEDIPEDYFLWKHYKKILKNHNLLQGSDIAPLVILNLKEFDDIMELLKNGYSFPELFKEKNSKEENRQISFWNYLHRIKKITGTGLPSHLENPYKLYEEFVIKELNLSDRQS